MMMMFSILNLHGQEKRNHAPHFLSAEIFKNLKKKKGNVNIYMYITNSDKVLPYFTLQKRKHKRGNQVMGHFHDVQNSGECSL